MSSIPLYFVRSMSEIISVHLDCLNQKKCRTQPKMFCSRPEFALLFPLISLLRRLECTEQSSLTGVTILQYNCWCWGYSSTWPFNVRKHFDSLHIFYDISFPIIILASYSSLEICIYILYRMDERK
jgi:hypothetical protein